jgi:hypothetical protein
MSNNDVLTIEKNGRILSIPRTFDRIGIGACTLDGMPIPASRLWDIVLEAIAADAPVDTDRLFEEGLRAEIYRLEEGYELIYSSEKMPGLKPVVSAAGEPYPNVWTQRTMLRVRPLARQLGVELAAIRGDVDVVSVRDTLRAAREAFGLHPVAAVDKRLFLHADPESIFARFGTRDWRRLGVYFKRPGTSSVRLNLED